MLSWKLVLLPLTLVWSYHQSSISSCLWHNNSCVEKCPEHMVEKKCDCNHSYWPAQRTCKNPEITFVGTVCGFSRCDCPTTLVFDTDTGFCYDYDNCPTKHTE